MKYLVSGSRGWSSWTLVRQFCEILMPGDEVAHGAAPNGFDFMVDWMLTDRRRGTGRARHVYIHNARGVAARQPKQGSSRGDIDVHRFPADWISHEPPEGSGRKNPAGVIRNARMLAEYQPDRFVFGMADPPTPGTGNMIDLCLKAEIPTWSIEDFIRDQRR